MPRWHRIQIKMLGIVNCRIVFVRVLRWLNRHVRGGFSLSSLHRLANLQLSSLGYCTSDWKWNSLIGVSRALKQFKKRKKRDYAAKVSEIALWQAPILCALVWPKKDNKNTAKVGSEGDPKSFIVFQTVNATTTTNERTKWKNFNIIFLLVCCLSLELHCIVGCGREAKKKLCNLVKRARLALEHDRSSLLFEQKEIFLIFSYFSSNFFIPTSLLLFFHTQ